VLSSGRSPACNRRPLTRVPGLQKLANRRPELQPALTHHLAAASRCAEARQEWASTSGVGEPEEFGKLEAEIKRRLDQLMERDVELEQLTLDCYLRFQDGNPRVVKMQDSMTIPITNVRNGVSQNS
jgi:hypothetical protein